MGKLFDTQLEINKLFPISDEEVVNAETGELLDISYLGELKLQRDEILTYLLQEVKNLDADVEAYRNQRMIFANKQKVAENKRDSLKNYIATALNGEAFEAADKSVKATFRSSESVNIIALDKLRDEYKRVIPASWEPDKKAIKEAIKSGLPVEGAELVTNNNMQVK